MTGVEQTIERVVRVTDGDTVRVIMHTDEMPATNGRTMRLRTRDTINGEPVRLIIVDTPERGEAGYITAREDLAAWLTAHTGRLRCETYDTAGWDRLLADIYVDGDRSNTATQHMLRLGWDPYTA